MALLTDRVALVTGGSRGIGRAVALALADAGAAVAVNYRERADDARSVVDAIRSAGGRAMAIGADVSRSVEVSAMVAAVVHELGPVDVLVNNAGLAIIRGVEDITEEEFDLTIAVNLKSAFLCTQAVVPAMRARKWGRIVNISSGAARGSSSTGCASRGANAASGTRTSMSANSVSRPPLRPTSTATGNSFSRAHRAALTTFGELPLPEIQRTASPLRASCSS